MATENQKALVESIGLKIHTTKDGRDILTKKGGEIPSGNDIIDIYYPDLMDRVVTQQVQDSFRQIFKLLDVVDKEFWINGLKEQFFNGIYNVGSYNKQITISDFNPADEKQYQILYSIDKRDIISKKITKIAIIAAFTSPAKLEQFVNNEIAYMLKTQNLRKQNEYGKILCNDSGAFFQMTYDLIVDTTGATSEDVIRLVKYEVYRKGTPSSNHLALDDDTIIYSANPDDLELVYDADFKTNVDLDIEAKLFHPSAIVTSLKEKVVSFKDIGLADDTTIPKIILKDKRSIVLGHQVEDAMWNLRVPKAQQLYELHNWWGFAVYPNYYKSIFLDVPANQVEEIKKAKPKEIASIKLEGKVIKLFQKTKYITLKDYFKKIKKEKNKDLQQINNSLKEISEKLNKKEESEES